MTDAFWSEVVGTGMLVLLGTGVVANVILPKNKGFDGGWLLINIGWGFAVMAGVLVSFKSGAYLNPAVVIGKWASSETGDATEFTKGIPITAVNGFWYVTAEMLGAAIGALLCFIAYKKHFDEEAPGATKLAVFSTGPAIRSYVWNFLTEVIGTFVLVFVVLAFSKNPADLGVLFVSFLVVGIGASLGGPTGYAINPARDLGPRIAHALLPIRGKGSSDWSYSWVPVLGPLIGGVLAGLLANAFI